MPSFDRVPQGFGGICRPPSPNRNQWVGTDGLGTCLGIYVAVQDATLGLGNFVAHADCAVQVTGGPGSADFNYVLETTNELMIAVLGQYDAQRHSNINTYSTSSDNSTIAMMNGVWYWYGFEPPFDNEAYGFRVQYDGTGLTRSSFKDPTEDIDGQFGFSILPPLEPWPAFPSDSAGGSRLASSKE